MPELGHRTVFTSLPCWHRTATFVAALVTATGGLAACASTPAPNPHAGGAGAAVSSTAPPASAQEAAREVARATEATAAAPASGEKTLFERLGGLPAIEAVVTEFRKNVAADERVNFTFGLTDMPTLHKRLVEFFCAATGGPCKYSGRNMKVAHHRMGVTGAHFDALVGDLVKTLDTFNVPEREKGEILGALGPMRKDIVEVE